MDRSLGRYEVATAIRDRGFTVHTLFEAYDTAEQWLGDEIWIRDSCLRGWVMLSKDLFKSAAGKQKRTIQDGNGRVFSIRKGQLSGGSQVAYFVNNLDAICAVALAHDGPYIYRVHQSHLRLWWPEDRDDLPQRVD